jgi:hypothetical protein
MGIMTALFVMNTRLSGMLLKLYGMKEPVNTVKNLLRTLGTLSILVLGVALECLKHGVKKIVPEIGVSSNLLMDITLK